jgi:hypothetical protein
VHRVAQSLTIAGDLHVRIFKDLRARASTYVPSLVPWLPHFG